ncbi:MAG: xanthine dehydrogenase small subunit [Bacteroidales bacterium]|nr:xanthine dehydrogenase small subunit [Bacteroidales bacterium]
MNKISFVFKNKIRTIDFNNSEFSPTSTLLEFIRAQQNTKGTKEGCNEGDCGACTVVVVEKSGNELKYRAVNSCVMFLPSIHGKQVLTIEDIGSSDNLHPIQQIFIDQHASQCGFCTPGFIMSLFAQKADNPNSSKDELIEAITGNLCRCTGYRPIVDSAVDISKLNDLKLFHNYANPELIDSIPVNDIVSLKTAKNEYYIPFNIEDAIKLRKEHKDAVITSGGTDLVLVVTKRKEHLPKIIDVSLLVDTQQIIETKDEIIFGAGVKIEDIYQFSKTKLPAMAEMLSLFGAKQIRNRATIGGNVGTASPIGDILPVLYAYNADIIIKGDTERKVNINDYIIGYRKTLLGENELIKAVSIQKPAPNRITKAYKISKRVNLDISTVSAGFSMELEKNIIKDIVLNYGGMAERPKRASETENFLNGKEWTEQVVTEAMKIVEKEFTPLTDARSSKEARIIMAKNLLLKFYLETK